MAEASKGVRVQDLPDLLNNSQPIFLLCDECFAQHSAHSGDYWDRPKDHVFMHCRKPMRLVKKETRFVDVPLARNKKKGGK